MNDCKHNWQRRIATYKDGEEEYYYCPLCMNQITGGNAIEMIDGLNSRIAELEQQLELSKPLYSRRQLESQNAKLVEALTTIKAKDTSTAGVMGTLAEIADEALKELEAGNERK